LAKDGKSLEHRQERLARRITAYPSFLHFPLSHFAALARLKVMKMMMMMLMMMMGKY